MTATEAAFKLIGTSLSNTDNLLAKAALTLGNECVIDGETYVEVQSLGFSLALNKHMEVSCVQIYSDGLDGYSAFPFEFRTLTMQSKSADVFSCLGLPQEQHKHWASYIEGKIRVHFEFDNDDGIRLISLTHKHWSPGDH